MDGSNTPVSCDCIEAYSNLYDGKHRKMDPPPEVGAVGNQDPEKRGLAIAHDDSTGGDR